MGKDPSDIQQVKVNQEGLIFVLSVKGDIFVLNNTLQNQNDGLIFKLKIPFMTSPLISFHFISDSDLFVPFPKPGQPVDQSAQKVTNWGDTVTDFMLKKKLKPTGRMVTVQANIVCLWDFDSEYDQKKNICRVLSQLVFSDTCKVRDCQYSQGVLLFQHEDHTCFSLAKIGKKRINSQSAQFLQLNYLQLPEFEGSQIRQAKLNLRVKRLRHQQIMVMLRCLSDKDVVRDFLTTVVDQSELHQQLLAQGFIQEPLWYEQMFASSPFVYRQAVLVEEVIKSASNIVKDVVTGYTEKSDAVAQTLFNIREKEKEKEQEVKDHHDEEENEQGNEVEVEIPIISETPPSPPKEVVAASRARLVSEDIWKELDDKVFGDPIISQFEANEPEEPARPRDESPRVVDEEDSEEAEAKGWLRLSQFSDKNLQKLTKLSEQQLERVRVLSAAAEKSTQGFKKLNKAIKQQHPQLQTKVKSQLSANLKAALTQSSVKLRKATVSKAQDFFNNTIENNIGSMEDRLKAKILQMQEKKNQGQEKQHDMIEQQVRTCIREELAPVLVETIEGSLYSQVQGSYEQMAQEYVQRQKQSNQDLQDYMDACEQIMQKGLGLRCDMDDAS